MPGLGWISDHLLPRLSCWATMSPCSSVCQPGVKFDSVKSRVRRSLLIGPAQPLSRVDDPPAFLAAEPSRPRGPCRRRAFVRDACTVQTPIGDLAVEYRGERFNAPLRAVVVRRKHALAMSAYGTKRTCRVALHMSAFGGKADIPVCAPKCPLMTQSEHRACKRTHSWQEIAAGIDATRKL